MAFEVCETLKMECLLPGTIVECTPEVEQKLSKTRGIFVNLGNGISSLSYLKIRGNICQMFEASSTDVTCRRESGKTLLDWEKRLGTVFKSDLTISKR